jgi:hypothetical protein
VSTSVLSLVSCLVLWTALVIPSAEAQDTGVATGLIHFDLASQPLANAIDAYGRLTGMSVFVRSTLLDSRTSAPVHGDYPATDALRRLLDGTGLQVTANTDGVAIVPSPSVSAAPISEASSTAIPATAIAGAQIDGDDYHWYAAEVQARLTHVLCEDAQTRPGTYRLLIQLTIGASGAVTSSRLFGSTGVAARDAAILRAARSIVFDSSPPAILPQPVTILLHPLASDVVDVCAPARSQD